MNCPSRAVLFLSRDLKPPYLKPNCIFNTHFSFFVLFFPKEYMLKIPDLKIIRVYGDRREQAEFPIPNKRQPLKNSTDDNNQILNEDDELKAVSLHHVIRRNPCPFAAELREYERKFDDDRKNDRRTSDKEVHDYREVRIVPFKDTVLISKRRSSRIITPRFGSRTTMT